jgi:putative copper export protein
MHWLHLLGVVFWIGGIGYILFVLMSGIPMTSLRDRARMMPILLKRFLAIVWISIAVIVASGLFRVFYVMGMTTLDPFILSSYGNLLLLKIILVIALIGVASSVTLRQYPRTLKHLTTHLNDPPESYRCQQCGSIVGGLRNHLDIGLALALVIIFLAAMLRGA